MNFQAVLNYNDANLLPATAVVAIVLFFVREVLESRRQQVEVRRAVVADYANLAVQDELALASEVARLQDEQRRLATVARRFPLHPAYWRPPSRARYPAHLARPRTASKHDIVIGFGEPVGRAIARSVTREMRAGECAAPCSSGQTFARGSSYARVSEPRWPRSSASESIAVLRCAARSIVRQG